jgi:hypothetical protein
MDMTVSVSNTQSSLVEFSSYLETVTKEDAIESIKNLAQMESEDWFRIGMILSSYRKSKGDEEFKSLLTYAEQNLQVNGRKAYYLISIHDSLVTSHITPSQVSEVGWTKLKEIAHLLTPENVDYWVDLCKTNTTKQLVALLKSGSTTNADKAAAIDAALEDSAVVTSIAPGVAPGVVITQEDLDTPDPITYAMATELAKAIDSDILEAIPEGKYSEIVPLTDFSVNTSIKDVSPVPCDTEPKAQIEMLTEAPPEETVIAFNETTVADVDKLVSLLKVYSMTTVVSMVTEIYPHITIMVTEKNDASIID